MRRAASWDRGFPVALLALLLFSQFAYAGWSDLVFSSQENYWDFHQGRPVSLSVNVSNNGDTSGYAVYITNVTLHPPDCVNGGMPITSSGIILCPNQDDTGCRNRFRNAGATAIFNFTNITTDASCINGLRTYNFTFEGSDELLGVGSSWYNRTPASTANYYMRFIGADSCGDGVCAPTENCTLCEADCGRCPECSGSTRTCYNHSVMECSNGFYTRLIEACAYGCEIVNGTPACRHICSEGERHCADDARTLQTCRNNAWANETCPRGCVDNACETDLCTGIACPDKCEAGRAYSYGSCNPSTGNCTYYGTVACQYACSGTVCATSPPTTPTPAPSPGGIPCCSLGLLLLSGLAFAAFRR